MAIGIPIGCDPCTFFLWVLSSVTRCTVLYIGTESLKNMRNDHFSISNSTIKDSGLRVYSTLRCIRNVCKHTSQKIYETWLTQLTRKLNPSPSNILIIFCSTHHHTLSFTNNKSNCELVDCFSFWVRGEENSSKFPITACIYTGLTCFNFYIFWI